MMQGSVASTPPAKVQTGRRPLGRVLKLVASFGGGLVLLGIAHSLTLPPHPHTVWVVKTAVSPGTPITPQTVTPLKTLSAWPHALTTVPTGWVAKTALAPGQPLLASAVTPAAGFRGLKAHEAVWTIPVSAVGSGMVQPGDRVDVWSDPQSQPTSGNTASTGFATEWATGVRVLGIYSSSGTPVSGQTAIGIVTLAVPTSALPILLTIANPALVMTPAATHFALVVNTAPVSTTAPAPTKAAAHASRPKG
ncbi:hypothetical protein BXT84_00520 [Sulfobacillus thermotolerans]|uniref:SAF domain-containing protein n=1 Tax=Sulfobacillus thermotolerans TaxID=338644 RepID=A0ABM6RMT0_9FIRM|nr:hypothetical protein BXT84_00520 [Sulfobacillus thermotolerans]